MTEPTTLRLALAQMRCEKGALAQNLAETQRYLQLAAEQGADIVAFPEASLTGYVEPLRYPKALVSLDESLVAAFVKATAPYGMTVLAGIIERHPDDQPPFVTQVVARAGELLGVYRKRHIVDGEAGWFTPGDASPVFEHNGLTFGIAICADISLRAAFADAAERGAQLVFEVAAPGLFGEQATRNWASGHAWWRGECDTYLSGYARDLGLWIAVATQAGRTADEDFPGGGYLYDPHGHCVQASQDWHDELLVAEITF